MTLLQKGVYQTRTNTPDAPVTMAVFLSVTRTSLLGKQHCWCVRFTPRCWALTWVRQVPISTRIEPEPSPSQVSVQKTDANLGYRRDLHIVRTTRNCALPLIMRA